MSTFKQKKVIKSYKLRLQEKFRVVSDETENAVLFLNKCLKEFERRVHTILDIKDEKCLSLYRKLIKDLENYSEKLFILQSALDDCSDESDSEIDSKEENESVSQNSNEPLSSTLEASSSLSKITSMKELSSVIHQKQESDYQISHIEVDEDNTEDDFYSVQSEALTSQSNFVETVQNNIFQNELTFSVKNESVHSNAHSSYHSFSSELSDALTVPHSRENTESQTFVKTIEDLREESQRVSLPPVVVPSNFSATLSHIVDPGNFWIQMKSDKDPNLNFHRFEYLRTSGLSSLKVDEYCLAPYKSAPFYFRAKALNNVDSETGVAKLFYLDNGFVYDVPLCELRVLPSSVCDIPAQALHCFLYQVAPVGSSWTVEAIKKFKDFQEFTIEVTVKLIYNDMYGVQLTAKQFAEFDEDFSIDIGQSLYIDGLAEFKDDPMQKSENNSARCDSGVSVTSTYRSNQGPICADWNESNSSYTFNKSTLCSESNSNILKYSCFKCAKRDVCLHMKVPAATPVFVEKNMMIVMISHVVDPSEFYVNIAVENAVTLDELREQMTSLYPQSGFKQSIQKQDIFQGMFCATYYNKDGYWYRVKVLNTSLQDDSMSHVLVQYIDYGNCSVVNCSDLRPLLPQFSVQPAYGVRCSLAGVSPLLTKDKLVAQCWDDNAVKIFKKLVSLDKFLTAQVCSKVEFSNCETYEILLWDTEGSEDVLINLSLADQHVAKFDCTYIKQLTVGEVNGKSQETDILNSWDPMADDYYSIENSYGVYDDDNAEVATTGYSSKDFEYTCKYFALRGKCPRGSKCTLQHLPLLEDGITRDQEETFCVNLHPIIPRTDGYFLVQISAIVNPWHFYVVLPFGTKTVEEIDTLVHKGTPLDEILNKENLIFCAMNKHYTSAPFQENTKLALAPGTIVAAKRKWDGQWMRGRVIDVNSIEGPAKIFFVDSGDVEWVPRKLIRSIEPQFIHTPFQAIECRLFGVEPIGLASGELWSLEAINFFKNAVSGEILLASIINRMDEILYLSIRKTAKHYHQDLAKMLVTYGFARHSVKSLSKSEQLGPFIPG